MLFKDKVALITGGSRGLGHAVARKFSEEGARLILWARDREKLSQVKDELGGHIIVQKVDLGKVSLIRENLEQAIRDCGHIDILVNAAALPLIGSFVDASEEEYDAIFDVNAKGAFFLAQGVVRHMIEQKIKGTVIFVSSVSAKTAPPMGSVYSASKTALISLTQSLSKELAPHGIRVNSICPGAMDTDMLHKDTIARLAQIRGTTYENMLKGYLSMIPQKRLLDPLEVADLITFLCSEKSKGITGQSINICCGTESH